MAKESGEVKGKQEKPKKKVKRIGRAAFTLEDYAIQMLVFYPTNFRNAVLGIDFRGRRTRGFIDLNVSGQDLETNITRLGAVVSKLGFDGAIVRKHLAFLQQMQQNLAVAHSVQRVLSDTDPVYFSDHPPTEEAKQILSKLR